LLELNSNCLAGKRVRGGPINCRRRIRTSWTGLQTILPMRIGPGQTF